MCAMKDTDVQKKIFPLRCMKEFTLPEILVIIEKCRLHVNASHLARRINEGKFIASHDAPEK
jgi:hypothetical protein